MELRAVESEDLETFHRFEADPGAARSAAFVPLDFADRRAFDLRWSLRLRMPQVRVRTVVAGDEVAGYVTSFPGTSLPGGDPHERPEVREISYWVGAGFRHKGVATAAVAVFLGEVGRDHLLARAAADNTGSLIVLERNGFRTVRTVRSYSEWRGEWLDEVELERPAGPADVGA